MSGGIRVRFFGVRGSTPCDGPHLARYGGNTSCVVLEADGQPPIVFDLGTGLRNYGLALAKEGRAQGFHGSVLLSHLHWDHVQGLPFFGPLACGEARVDVFGPRQPEGPLDQVFAGLMKPPYFPITPDCLEGDVRFHDAGEDDFPVGQAKVRSRWIRHTGPTLGFRVDWNGVSVAYISDHGPGCAPDDSDDHVPADVLDLADGVDLLIHDAQHTGPEFEAKRHYGHCTVDYAVHVARESGARRLALFHHDPAHGDDELDHLLLGAQDLASRRNAGDVVAAHEGLELTLQPAATSTGVPA
jgi:phosphoribosyl 1,2-cyclic phosphodiesterase